MDNMLITADGGSHLIAAAVTDIYSKNFQQNLKMWLESIPQYPKPFDMQFQPLTEMLHGMVGEFIDEDCTAQCFAQVENGGDLTVDDSDACTVTSQEIDLNDSFGQPFVLHVFRV